MAVRNAVRNFILHNFLFSDNPNELDDQESLIEKGVIDSTGVLELVAFLETEFGVSVLDDEMIPANLDSVHAIVAFIDRKRAPMTAQRAM